MIKNNGFRIKNSFNKRTSTGEIERKSQINKIKLRATFTYNVAFMRSITNI